MYANIERLIQGFDGRVYAVAGLMMGFFDDPGQARLCAEALIRLTEREVEVFGNQLCLFL
jgi:hypothetical protein